METRVPQVMEGRIKQIVVVEGFFLPFFIFPVVYSDTARAMASLSSCNCYGMKGKRTRVD